MVKRPFISKRIDELEQMFKTSGDLLTLKGLEDELVHRSTPRAVGLLRAVRKKLSLPEFVAKIPEPSLFDPPVGTLNLAPAQPGRTAPLQDSNSKPFPAVQAPLLRPETRGSEPGPGASPRRGLISFPAAESPRSNPQDGNMSSEEACKVLHVTLGASWQTIEEARREIVLRSHPNKIRLFSPERQKPIIEQARRANAAAQILFGMRIGENTNAAPIAEGLKSV